jgi:hypothetical protein
MANLTTATGFSGYKIQSRRTSGPILGELPPKELQASKEINTMPDTANPAGITQALEPLHGDFQDNLQSSEA